MTNLAKLLESTHRLLVHAKGNAVLIHDAVTANDENELDQLSKIRSLSYDIWKLAYENEMAAAGRVEQDALCANVCCDDEGVVDIAARRQQRSATG